MNMATVSYRDIAQAAGVGVATVSRALTGDRRVAKETRVKVQNVARELGYVRSPALAALGAARFRQSGRVALDLVWLSQKNTLPEDVRAAAERRGYRLTLETVSSETSPERLSRTLYNRGVEGIFLDPFLGDHAFLDNFDWSPFCVLAAKRIADDSPFHAVSTNAFLSITMAWHHAEECGYQRVGFVLFEHSPPHPDDDLRMGAVLRCQQSVPPERRLPPFFLHGAAFLTEDFEAIPAWLKEHQPDCIVGFNEYTGIGLNDHGYRFPQDFGFIALHSPGKSVHGYAGIVPRQEELPAAMIDFMDQLYRTGDRGIPAAPRSIQIPPFWLPGESLRKNRRQEQNGKGNPPC